MAKIKKQLYLTRKQTDILKRHVEEEDIQFSELIRKILDDYIRRNKLR